MREGEGREGGRGREREGERGERGGGGGERDREGRREGRGGGGMFTFGMTPSLSVEPHMLTDVHSHGLKSVMRYERY